MTLDKESDIYQRGVKGIRTVYQLMDRRVFWRRCKEVWEGVTVVRMCGSPQLGRCDGHGEKKGGLGRCSS